MADDIKIKVGVRSDVKAGMDQVVRDVERGARGIKVDRAMSGKGFMEVFGKAIRGDISGALEELQERMGNGMRSITAKALVWGGGIATAIVAGFKAGNQLDEMFGISSKIANFFVPKGPVGLDELTKRLRANRNAAEKEIEDAKKLAQESAKKDVENQKAIIEEKRDAIAKIEDDAFEKGQRMDKVREELEAKKGFGGGFASIAARLTGKRDLTVAEKADDDMKRLTDRDYDRQQKDLEKETARAQKRLELREKMFANKNIKGGFADRVREANKAALDVEGKRDFLTDYERQMQRLNKEQKELMQGIKENTATLKILEQIVKV
jgi:hypothetical protein